MSAPLRLGLIRADDHHHRYLESLLRASFDVRLVVVEPESEKVRAMRRRWRDYTYHVYHSWRRRLTGKDRYRRRYFAHSPQLWAASATPVHRVRSVNDPAVVAAFDAEPVDVTVIIGC
jgi:hypothetical protein